MSGHSKWSTIKRKKGATDAARAKIFTKLGRAIMVAVKQGGPDASSNSALKEVLVKARYNNMPSDNISKIIKKASGNLSENENYEPITYEGYGPNGVAVIVEALTNNRNRTAGDMRHYFDKYGGTLGQSGSVSFMFEQKGVVVIYKNGKFTEEEITEHVLESDAEDINVFDSHYEILMEPVNFGSVRNFFEKKGYDVSKSELTYIPSTTVELTEEEVIKKMNRLLELLEENDDVQEVYHNWEE